MLPKKILTPLYEAILIEIEDFISSKRKIFRILSSEELAERTRSTKFIKLIKSKSAWQEVVSQSMNRVFNQSLHIQVNNLVAAHSQWFRLSLPRHFFAGLLLTDYL